MLHPPNVGALCRQACSRRILVWSILNTLFCFQLVVFLPRPFLSNTKNKKFEFFILIFLLNFHWRPIEPQITAIICPSDGRERAAIRIEDILSHQSVIVFQY